MFTASPIPFSDLEVKVTDIFHVTCKQEFRYATLSHEISSLQVLFECLNPLVTEVLQIF